MLLDCAELRRLLDYNPETGVFTWRVWSKLAGSSCKKTGRVLIGLGGRAGRQYLAHRLAWLYVYGEWPALPIDHIDGNQANNAIANLRLATKSENGQNVRHARSTSRSGVLGVWWSKTHQKWVAEVILNKRRVHCTTHRLLEEAVAAHAAAKAKHHPFTAADARTTGVLHAA